MIVPRFIVLEGIDGSGTSTQIERLKHKTAGKKFFFTCEPTSRETGVFLRQMLQGKVELHPDTSARLFAADRSEHLYGKDGILDLIKQGFVVISDRYLFSSLAYQSSLCGPELPRKLNEDFPLPEYLFFFDIDAKTAMSRITGRGKTEIYEKEAFLNKTARQYRQIMDEYKDSGMHIVSLDATKPIEFLTEKIWSVVSKMPID